MAISNRNSMIFSFGSRSSASAPPTQHQPPYTAKLMPTSLYDPRNTVNGITRSRSFPPTMRKAEEDDAKLVELVNRIQKCVDTIQEIKHEVDSAAAKMHRRHTHPCP
ncbi:hypothetical protein H310_12362 [Aphanomyces invadans]|uniref:Uncharacterized protein n=1 Tax=Aphanomyces invadans TaxID=157072 RepID=A0A024TIH0_9STRA|nr:hypothetical protein H310_12362 [Aphanomyces invadans]ETV93799.1 hypothetical protein H310_12362 [Aphanomyces invadans]|eukprot:XP_008877608.1 hypothetical protein H310_12362 [Aphanomyces invadans]